MATDIKKVDPLTEDQLKQKEAELQLLEAHLTDEKETLDKDKAAFQAEKEAFETEKSELEESKKSLDKRKTDLDELEKSLMEVGTEKVEHEPEPGLEFTSDKQKLKFRDGAPKRILLANGKKLTQEEIVKDKEALASIINSNLIQKIK